MRLFIRSYTKYIDADYEQALVDYELHTTGKVQPKFFENEQTEKSRPNNNLSPTELFNNSEDFQIDYKQIITIILTLIAIYSGFKLIEFISNDGTANNQIEDSDISSVEFQ